MERLKKIGQIKVLSSAFPTRKIRARNRLFNRQYGLDFMASMSDYDVRRMFRMGRSAFGSLAQAISLRLSIDVMQAENSSGSHVSIVTRLACTLPMVDRWISPRHIRALRSKQFQLFSLPRSHMANYSCN
jgi:hypothetical protein